MRKMEERFTTSHFNYNTSYHTSVGCEPSRIIYGRVPYDILDHKLWLKPTPGLIPTRDFADERIRTTQLLFDKTKKNVMHSYIRLKSIMTKKQKLHHCMRKTTSINYNSKRITKDQKYPLEISDGSVLL